MAWAQNFASHGGRAVTSHRPRSLIGWRRALGDLLEGSLLCVLHLESPLKLGSFSGFDQVPLLHALEPVFEDAALWLEFAKGPWDLITQLYF